MLNGFGTVVNALGKRVKPYLPQICGTILWRLNNKSAKVRQQAADLISRIAIVMKTCQEVLLNLSSIYYLAVQAYYVFFFCFFFFKNKRGLYYSTKNLMKYFKIWHKFSLGHIMLGVLTKVTILFAHICRHLVLMSSHIIL